MDLVFLALLQGLAPETIAAECFPMLIPEQVYGAVTYYLAHQAEIDAHLKHADSDFQALWRATQSISPEFSRH